MARAASGAALPSGQSVGRRILPTCSGDSPLLSVGLQHLNAPDGIAATNDRRNPALGGGVSHTHRALWEVSDELARLVGDAGDRATRRWIDNFFTVARSLHSNFYEDRAHADDLDGLMLGEEFSQRLYELFRPGGLPARTDTLQ